MISVNRERAKNAVTSIKCCEMKYNRFCVSPNILRSTNAFLILLNRIGLIERNGETSLKRCVGPYSRPYYTNALGQQQSYREYIVYTHAACIQHPCSQLFNWLRNFLTDFSTKLCFFFFSTPTWKFSTDFSTDRVASFNHSFSIVSYFYSFLTPFPLFVLQKCQRASSPIKTPTQRRYVIDINAKI